MNNQLTTIFLQFALLVSVFNLVMGCQKKEEIDPVQQEIQEKYSKYINGLKDTLDQKHKEIMQIANEHDSEGGAHPDDLNEYKQAGIDRLTELRLLRIDTETRRYLLTSLGKDVYESF